MSSSSQQLPEGESTISIPRVMGDTAPPPPGFGFHPVLIVLEGMSKGTRIKLDRDEIVVGRSPEAHAVIQDEGVSRKHFRVVRAAVAGCADECLIEDLGSHNGTQVNGEAISGPRALNERDRVTAGRALLGFFLRDEEELRNEVSLFDQATRDPLTGLNNRRRFMDVMKHHLEGTAERGAAFSLIVADIDFFKKLNDQYGHAVGDVALRHMAGVILSTVRSGDLPARWGGEEFVIALPRAAEPEAAAMAERLRRAVEVSPVRVDGKSIPFSVSLGVAQRLVSEPFEAWFARADERLYRAKAEGRNRVVSA